MSFDNTIDFKDHIVQYPNRFKQTTVAPGVVELVPTWITNSNEIIEPGTPVDSELFKKLKQNVTIYQQTFTTTENQTVINLNRDFLVGQNRVSLSIGGVRQYSGQDYTETDSHTLTMTTPQKGGLKAEVIMFTASQAIAEDFFEKTMAAIEATQSANDAATQALAAKETAYTVQLTPVANFVAIATTYPTAVNGSEVQTLDDGKIYRKENGSWVYRKALTPGPVADLLNKFELQKYYVNPKDFGAVGDGVTDDTAAIQAAIDKVATASPNFPLAGGTVIIPRNATFVFTVLLVRSNVTLKGMGGVLKLKNGTCVDANTNYYLIHTMGQNNVTLDDLIVDANSANNPSALVADTITVTGDNHVVKNCKLFNAVDSGIMFSSCKRSTVRDNVLIGGRDLGIYVNDGTGDTHYENIVTENHIQGFTYGGIALKRISRRTIVTENDIFECGNGITLERASTTTDFSKDVTITNNRMRRIGYNVPDSGKPTPAGIAIQLQRSHHTIVKENRIEDVRVTAIGMSGTEYANVSDNTITMTTDSDQQSQAIIINDLSGEASRYNKVKNNIITGARRYGIRLAASVGAQYNDVRGNTVVMGTNPLNGAYALRVESGWSYNKLGDNTLNGQFDIEVQTGAHNNTMLNNTYVNNAITGNVEQALQTIYLKLKDKRVSVGSSAPTGTTYTWNVGDIVYNTSPVPGGYAGWVCTTAGAPGAWKGFGLIQA